MAKKIFIAGLAYSVSDDQLGSLFSQFGEVQSAKVIMDHDTGRSRGFGFVEMSSEKECANAIASLNETQFEGRTLMVKEAKPREASSSRSSDTRYRNNNNRFNKNY